MQIRSHAVLWLVGASIGMAAASEQLRFTGDGYGMFHHVGDGFLPMYLSEMDFRYSHRKVTDTVRFAQLMRQVGGKRLLWFCKTA